MIHIGMHPDDEVYFVEKRARRQRYEHAGVDGRLLAKNALKGQPEKLFVGFDVDEMVGRVVGMLHVGSDVSVPKILVRISDMLYMAIMMMSASKHRMVQGFMSANCCRMFHSTSFFRRRSSHASFSCMFPKRMRRQASREASILLRLW